MDAANGIAVVVRPRLLAETLAEVLSAAGLPQIGLSPDGAAVVVTVRGHQADVPSLHVRRIELPETGFEGRGAEYVDGVRREVHFHGLLDVVSRLRDAAIRGRRPPEP